MTQNSNDLIRLALLNQRVVDNNVLLPGQTEKVRVAVRTPLATVDNIQFLKRELQFPSKVLNTRLQLTRLQRRQLVEQRQDSNRIDRDSENLNEHTKQPQVVEERVTSELDNLEHPTDNRSTQDNPEHLTLEHIRNPQLQRLLIEPEFLLENKRAVIRDRKRQNRTENIEPEEKHQRLADFTLEPSRKIPSERDTSDPPELREHVTVDKREILNLTVETSDETELGFGATVCLPLLTTPFYVPMFVAPLVTYLRLIVDFLRNFIFKNLGRLCPLQDLVLPEGQESLQQVLTQREPD